MNFYSTNKIRLLIFALLSILISGCLNKTTQIPSSQNYINANSLTDKSVSPQPEKKSTKVVKQAPKAPVDSKNLLMSYRRLLPLEGSSNFRDLGGYKTVDGQRVVRGKIFRSGAMVSLTKTDMTYLDRFHFKTVVDLRSREEIKLFPNYWATRPESKINFLALDYSIMDLIKHPHKKEVDFGSERMIKTYKKFPIKFKAHMKIFFENLLQQKTPLVVNCAAGQDRTGFASALLLLSLGVPKDVVVEDYQLSTDFRRPVNEMSNIDLEQAAKTNAFAKLMLELKKKRSSDWPNPLRTKNGKAYIEFAIDSIIEKYGSIDNYLTSELKVSAQDLLQLKKLYLVKNPDI